MFGRRWSFGSDDLVLPTIVLALLHTAWYVTLIALLIYCLRVTRATFDELHPQDTTVFWTR